MAVCTSSLENDEQLLLESMEMLIKAGATIDAVDKFGCTPLHYAARFGRAHLIAYLVGHGADINHTNQNGWSVSCCCCCWIEDYLSPSPW